MMDETRGRQEHGPSEAAPCVCLCYCLTCWWWSVVVLRRALVLEASSWSMLTALGPSPILLRGVEAAEEAPLAMACVVVWGCVWACESSGMVWPHLDSSTCSSRIDATTHTQSRKSRRTSGPERNTYGWRLSDVV